MIRALREWPGLVYSLIKLSTGDWRCALPDQRVFPAQKCLSGACRYSGFSGETHCRWGRHPITGHRKQSCLQSCASPLPIRPDQSACSARCRRGGVGRPRCTQLAFDSKGIGSREVFLKSFGLLNLLADQKCHSSDCGNSNVNPQIWLGHSRADGNPSRLRQLHSGAVSPSRQRRD